MARLEWRGERTLRVLELLVDNQKQLGASHGRASRDLADRTERLDLLLDTPSPANRSAPLETVHEPEPQWAFGTRARLGPHQDTPMPLD